MMTPQKIPWVRVGSSKQQFDEHDKLFVRFHIFNIDACKSFFYRCGTLIWAKDSVSSCQIVCCLYQLVCTNRSKNAAMMTVAIQLYWEPRTRQRDDIQKHPWKVGKLEQRTTIVEKPSNFSGCLQEFQFIRMHLQPSLPSATQQYVLSL